MFLQGHFKSGINQPPSTLASSFLHYIKLTFRPFRDFLLTGDSSPREWLLKQCAGSGLVRCLNSSTVRQVMEANGLW